MEDQKENAFATSCRAATTPSRSAPSQRSGSTVRNISPGVAVRIPSLMPRPAIKGYQPALGCRCSAISCAQRGGQRSGPPEDRENQIGPFAGVVWHLNVGIRRFRLRPSAGQQPSCSLQVQRSPQGSAPSPRQSDSAAAPTGDHLDPTIFSLMHLIRSIVHKRFAPGISSKVRPKVQFPSRRAVHRKITKPAAGTDRSTTRLPSGFSTIAIARPISPDSVE